MWSLAHHVIAVYTHAFSRERFHLLHQYNSTTALPVPFPPSSSSSPSSTSSLSDAKDSGREAVKVFQRVTTSVTVPCSMPAPASLTQSRSRRVHPLVLVGDKDELIAPQNSLTLAKYLRCPCLVFKDSGHMIYVEHPMAFANILHKHFSTSLHPLSPSSPPLCWYEDATIKVIDYTLSERGGHRRASTIASTLSSGGRERGSMVGGMGGVRGLLTFFFVWKLVQSLPQLRAVMRAQWWGGMREILRPLLLLYGHLRSLLLWRVRTILQWMRHVAH